MNVREEFLSYFESKMHERKESAPLVPNDPSLLFNNAGMVAFKSIFTGEVPPPQNPRATSCQLCLRAGGKHNDLENVGYTTRHHTLFEMLGNFSFGDYFKEDAISYAWEFITKVLGFDKDRLWVSVHTDDDEAYSIWLNYIDKNRIVKLGDKDNFWQMGESGPCGPCSEIFVDQGAELFNSSEDYLGGDGDRFLEIWNLVFMQYERTLDGDLKPLPHPSIDTGMGLERVVALMENKKSNYDSSLFMPIINKIATLLKREYVYENGASFRVISDHIRTVTLLLSQGLNFSNEGRGYVLRRILRRAVRHGYLLGFTEPFMFKLCDTVIEIMGSEYHYLKEKSSTLKEQLELEEKRFFKTIADGIELFNKELQKSTDLFSGATAFKLYDTFGFPLDLTEDMLRERGISLDTDEFHKLMSEQKKRAKAAWKGSGDAVNSGDFKELLERFGESEFVGYKTLKSRCKVLALLSEEFKIEEQLHKNHSGWVLLDKTPFYAEGGGQCGDRGSLIDTADVLETKTFFSLSLSRIEAKRSIKAGEYVEAVVDSSRKEIERHHSATHLLHAALIEQLGEHVCQAGSLVEATRLRFDFSHPKPLTDQELKEIEESVNLSVQANINSIIEEMDIESANKLGAKSLFGEKYGERVRVVNFGGRSIEFCGGTHVANTSEIGMFIITKESGVSSGVRRIEAVCSNATYNHFKQERAKSEEAKKLLKNIDLLAGIKRQLEQIKVLKQELKSQQKTSKQKFATEKIGGVDTVIALLESGDIKELIDEIKNAHESVAVMFFQQKGDKVLIAAGVKNAPLKAGEWIKKIAPILGGGGGGRDDFAQAGGKDSSKIPDAIQSSKEFLNSKLS